MAVKIKHDSKAKVKNIHDGDEIYNYAIYNTIKEKYFKNNTNQNKEQTAENTNSNINEKKQFPIQNNDNRQSNINTNQSKLLVPPNTNLDRINQIKENLGLSAKPIYNSMVQGFKDQIVDQYHNVAEAATGQMPKSKEYRIGNNILGLGNEMILSSVLKMKTNTILTGISNIKDEADSLNPENLNNVHKILFNSKITAQENFSLRGTKDLKRLSREMDIYIRKKIKQENLPDEVNNLLKNRDLSQLSKNELNIIINKLSQNNNGNSSCDEIINMASITKGIKEKKIFNLKIDGIGKPSIYRKSSRIMKTVMEDNAGYKGYRKTKETYFMAKAMMKATLFQGKIMYKASKSAGFIITKGGTSLSNLTGFQSGSHWFQELYNTGATTTRLLEEKSRLPSKAVRIGKHKVGNVAKDIKQMSTNIKIRTGNEITKNSKKIVTAASKKMDQNAKAKIVKKGLKTVKKGAKVTGKTTSFLMKGPVGIFKVSAKGISFIQALIKKLALLLAKIIVGAFAACGGLLVILGVFMALVTAVTTIGDAVSESYESFCQNTAMGKAYNMLLDYEKTFYSEIQNFYNTQTVALNEEGYPIQGVYNYGKQETITKYDYETINIVDGNGVQLSGNDRYNTKAILAMAAVYIEQDFSKYSGVGGLLGGIYQDYCQRLFENSHSAYIEVPKQSDVYYCSDSDPKYGGSKAASDCSNKQSITHEEEYHSRNKNLVSLPSGCKYFTVTPYWECDHDCGDLDCTHDCSDSEIGCGGYYIYTCKGHEYCKGHIDAKVQAIISGAYLPEDYDHIDSNDITETNNNLYDVDVYGNAYMYENASDTPLGTIASISLNITGNIFSVPLSFIDINYGDMIVDGAAGMTIYYEFNGEKKDAEGNDYKFRTTAGEPNKNFDGWTEDNKTWVRALLANDWKELYKIDLETDLASIEFDSGSFGGHVSGEYIGDDVGIPVMYYNQGDFAGYPMKPGCSSDIKSSGCGFCSLAMIATTLTGDDKYTPIYVVNQLAKDFYVCGQGGAHTLPTLGAARFGLTGTQIALSSQTFADVINNGGLVMALIGNPNPPTAFYSGSGHYIVIRGVTESGKIVVADPGRRANNNSAWPIDQLRLRKAWSIYYNE